MAIVAGAGILSDFSGVDDGWVMVRVLFGRSFAGTAGNWSVFTDSYSGFV